MVTVRTPDPDDDLYSKVPAPANVPTGKYPIEEFTTEELIGELKRRSVALLVVRVSVDSNNTDVWSTGVKGSVPMILACAEQGALAVNREIARLVDEAKRSQGYDDGYPK